MFKISIDREWVINTGEVSSTITIIESDDGVGKTVIPYGKTFIETLTIYEKNWDELNQREANILREIRKHIDVLRENMKIISSSKTIEY
jgi:hypothetical protein